MEVFPCASGDKVEKYHVALLFNSGTTASPTWVQLAAAESNTINFNAETEDRDFITMKAKKTLIKQYKPSLSNPLTLFKGNADYDYFWPKCYNLPTGSGANGEMLVVFLNEDNGEGANTTYDAWLCDVTFVMDNLDPVNSQLTFTTNINTWKEGTVKITSGTPAFTPALLQPLNI